MNLKNGIETAFAGGKTKEVTYKIFEQAIFWCIATTFFLTPLFFTGQVNQGSGFEKSLLFYYLTLIGIVVWATKGVVYGELKLKRTPLDLAMLGVFVMFAISTFLSVSKKDSLIGFYGNPAKSLIAIAVLAFFYFLVVNNVDTKKIRNIFFAIMGAGVLLLAYSFLQVFGVYILPIAAAKSPGFNPLSSLTSLTIYLTALIPFFVVAAAQTEAILPKVKNKTAVLAIRIIAGLALLATMTLLFFLSGFTYWPVVVVAIVLVLMFMLAKIVEVRQSFLFIPIAVFLLSIIFLVLGNFNIINLNLPAEVSLSRGLSFDIAKESIKKDPLFGSGVGTFYYDFSKYKSQAFNSSPLWNVRFDSSTGSLFELISTTGIAGTLAVIILVLISLSISFIALIKTNSKESQPILLASFSSTVALIVLSLLFAFNNALIIAALLLIIFNAAVAVNVYPERFETLTLSLRSAPKYALALTAIFLTVAAGVAVLFTMGIKIYLADYYALKSLEAADLDRKKANIEKSISLANYQDAYYLTAANYYIAAANQEASSGGKNQALIQENLNNAIVKARQGQELNPNYVGNNESLALIYENASFYTRGALEFAEQNYNKVIELEPQNPVPHLRLALINMARSNAEQDAKEKEYYINEAIKRYNEAIAKKNDFAAAFYGKAVAYEQLKKADDSIEQMKSAVVYASQNIDYQFELGRLLFNRGVTKPNLEQTASKQITEGDLNDQQRTSGEREDLSVQPDQATGATVNLNDDLKGAEQIFLAIVQANPNHANALYSLGLLYQKSSQTEKAKTHVKKLLEVLQDEPTKEAVKKQFPGLY